MTVVRQKELRELNILKIFKKKQTMVLITLGFLDSIAMSFVTARPSGPAASLLELAVYMATNVLMNWEKCFRVDTKAAPSNSMQFSLSQCSPPCVSGSHNAYPQNKIGLQKSAAFSDGKFTGES